MARPHPYRGLGPRLRPAPRVATTANWESRFKVETTKGKARAKNHLENRFKGEANEGKVLARNNWERRFKAEANKGKVLA